MIPESLLSKLKEKTTYKDGCWLFSSVNGGGHGQIFYEGRSYGVHRLVAHFYHGLELNNRRHRSYHNADCHNKNCWNPEHIHYKDHTIPTKRPYRYEPRPKRTHCKRGHPFTEENTDLYKDGGRRCRTCIRNYQHERYLRQRRKPTP